MDILGTLHKMRVELSDPVQYFLTLGGTEISLNTLIGQSLSIQYTGEIHCVQCHKKTRKSFNQGHCYSCFRRLPQCDLCIVKPELCHYEAGTCRDEKWGEAHCLQAHYVYLANSSGIKVGITRGTQIPTRWIDQGAVQALPIIQVSERLLSGLVEIALKQSVNDKTSWQKMLKGQIETVDLIAARDILLEQYESIFIALQQQFGEDSLIFLDDEDIISIHYPVIHYPKKIKSFNLDKQAQVTGQLMGIKGQYLIFDTGVLNIRKFAAYQVRLST